MQIWYCGRSRYVVVYPTKSDDVNAYRITELQFLLESRLIRTAPQDTCLLMKTVCDLIASNANTLNPVKGLCYASDDALQSPLEFTSKQIYAMR